MPLIEFPADDLARARRFWETLLDVSLDERARSLDPGGLSPPSCSPARTWSHVLISIDAGFEWRRAHESPVPKLGLPRAKPKRVPLRGPPAARLVDHEVIFADIH